MKSPSCCRSGRKIGVYYCTDHCGTKIDYKKDIMGSMFDIINPNAQSSCGCGVSVNFDMDKLAIPA